MAKQNHQRFSLKENYSSWLATHFMFLLFAINTPIKEVQKRLGHSDVQTTLNVYAHVTKEQDSETADRLGKAFNF